MKEQVVELIEQVNGKGWVAFHYPRRKQVSISGGSLQNYPAAVKQMKEMLNK